MAHIEPLLDITQRVSNYYTLYSKRPIFPRSIWKKITPGWKNLHKHRLWCLWQIWGMYSPNPSILLWLLWSLDWRRLFPRVFPPMLRRWEIVQVKVENQDGNTWEDKQLTDSGAGHENTRFSSCEMVLWWNFFSKQSWDLDLLARLRMSYKCA